MNHCSLFGFLPISLLDMIKMKKPLASVIMPSYNCGKWIEDSINSVLKQDYKKVELIIIDDNSSDNTHQIIQRFQKKEQKIIFHKMLKRSKNIAKLLNIRRLPPRISDTF